MNYMYRTMGQGSPCAVHNKNRSCFHVLGCVLVLLHRNKNLLIYMYAVMFYVIIIPDLEPCQLAMQRFTWMPGHLPYLKSGVFKKG